MTRQWMGLCAMMLLFTATSQGATTFVAEYNGNTGNGGLDADVVAGSAVAASTGSAVIDNVDFKYDGGSLNPTAATSGGNALTYDSAGNLVIGPSTAGTIEMWVKTTIDPAVARQFLFNSRLPNFEGEIGMEIFTSNPGQFGESRVRVFMDSTNSGGGVWFADSSLQNFTWDPNVFHHIAWNWDFSAPDPLDDFSSLYIDGVAEKFGATGGTIEFGNTMVASTFEIGSQQGGFDPLLGRIDSVRISDAAVYGEVASFTPPGPFVSPPVLLGDANKDGQVTGADLISVQQNFGNVGATPLQGDANNDGQVTGADLISVQQNFGNVAAPTAVPEPATLAILGLGLLTALRRRK